MRRLWEWWKRIAGRIADIQARVLLILFYFVVLSPFAVLVKWAGDPLALKRGGNGWRATEDGKTNLMDRALKQF